jgi:DNA-binding transcriptional regulator GbsR (MarR family)
MELDEAKEKFIQAWGALGTNWGITRTMAQIHALLLVCPRSLSADEIMAALNISRGNANMNLRGLIDWGLVSKEHRSGERREYFFAEKDIWQVAQQVILERRKRELKPVKKVLEEIKEVKPDPNNPEVTAFLEAVTSMDTVVGQADRFLEIVINSERNWFFNMLFKIFSRRPGDEFLR